MRWNDDAVYERLRPLGRHHDRRQNSADQNGSDDLAAIEILILKIHVGLSIGIQPQDSENLNYGGGVVGATVVGTTVVGTTVVVGVAVVVAGADDAA